MFLGSLALNCWYIRRSQQTAVKLLDLLKSHKTSIGFLFGWFFQDMGVFLHFFFVFVAIPHGQVLSCPNGRFQILHLLIRNFQFPHLKISVMQRPNKQNGYKTHHPIQCIVIFYSFKNIFDSFLLHQNVCLQSFFLSYDRTIFAISQLIKCFAAYGLEFF